MSENVDVTRVSLPKCLAEDTVHPTLLALIDPHPLQKAIYSSRPKFSETPLNELRWHNIFSHHFRPTIIPTSNGHPVIAETTNISTVHESNMYTFISSTMCSHRTVCVSHSPIRRNSKRRLSAANNDPLGRKLDGEIQKVTVFLQPCFVCAR